MIKTPFLVVNPKNFLMKKDLYTLIGAADKVAREVDFTIIVTAPYTELSSIKKSTKNVLVASQAVDCSEMGTNMGAVTPERLNDINVDAVVINHAENNCTYTEIISIVEDCNRMKMCSIVCCSSVTEAKAIALLKPTIILCEPTELIGKENSSNFSYILETTNAIKSINPDILVEQAAGVRSYEDVFKIIKAGADGTGATSAFVNAENFEGKIREFALAITEAVKYM